MKSLLLVLLIPIILVCLPGGVAAEAESDDDDAAEMRRERRRARITHDHVYMDHEDLGLDLEDVEDIESEGHESRHNSTTHMNLRQRVGGIPIIDANMGLAVDSEGQVFGRWSDFIAGARNRINRIEPELSAEEALVLAAPLLELPNPDEITILDSTPGPQQAMTLESDLLSRDPIPAKLVYRLTGEDLRLAWDLVLRTPDGHHWWNIQLDTETGELLGKVDWISRETYRVFGPPPILTPDQGAHVLTSPPSLVASPIASPYGWHDTDGIAGPEHTDTRGNNTWVQEDADANDIGGFRPDGGAGLVFDFPFDPNVEPASYQSASLTSLFYWINIAHDVFYQYGFDEASGNFQVNNYGRGGIGGDQVSADGHDGADINNARFGTPPDGYEGLMEMFLWSGPIQLVINSPPSIAGTVMAAGASFGPALPDPVLGGDVVAALDAANPEGPSSTDACSPFTNSASISGKIALADRGICNFTVKVANAQAAGAIAMIVANNVGDGILTMGGTDASITIPSIMVGQSDGAAIRAESGAANVTMQPSVMRDGSLDAGIVIHEYGHGVTSRLTGGASNTGCLTAAQSAGMGEGWSDFFGLFFGAKAGDQGTDSRPLGAYVISQASTGSGIRSQPYSTDMTINDLTLVDIETANQPHGVGEIWAATLWEVFWQLVDAHGFDSDIYNWTGGNNLALQLVMDGLKLQACHPTFTEARDAILLAEANATGEANRCLLWRGFAKRGLGAASAVAASALDVTTAEDFTLPASCSEFCADGVTAPAEQCDDANLIDLDGCSRTCRIEESYLFHGVAQGGSVDLVVEGQTISIVTLAGESAADVAVKMAAAITANVTLESLGAVAQASGDSIVVAGQITSSVISDPGLAPPVPLSDWLPPAIALFLGISGILWLDGNRRRHHGPHLPH